MISSQHDNGLRAQGKDESTHIRRGTEHYSTPRLQCFGRLQHIVGQSNRLNKDEGLQEDGFIEP